MQTPSKINMSQDHFAHLLERIQELQLYIANGQPLTASQKAVAEKAICKCLKILNSSKPIL
jgi:hypothetical protein